MNCLCIKNPINATFYLEWLRDFPVYCKIKLQKNNDLQCYNFTYSP